MFRAVSSLRTRVADPPRPSTDPHRESLKDGQIDEILFYGAVVGGGRTVSKPESTQRSDDTETVITNPWFRGTIWVLVALNTLQMGIEADHPEYTDLWFVCENIFTFGFVMEMVVKLYALRLRYFYDKANWLDAAIVLLAVFDVWILSALGEDVGDLQNFSILRLLRLFRLVRVLKLLKQWRRVVLVVHGLFAAMQATIFVGALLALSIYACAIFCVSMIGRQTMYPGYTEEMSEINEQEVLAEFNPYLSFGSMGKSMLTLFSIAIFAEWTEIVRPVYVKQPGLVLFFVAFALFVCFGVMNTIIGMIVDSVMDYSSRIEQAEQETMRKTRRSKVRKVIRMLDVEYPDIGELGADEVAKCMQSETMQELLQGIDLPHGFTSGEVMSILDNNGSGTLTREEFIRNLFRIFDGGDFQHTCMLQSGLNELKRAIRDQTESLETRLQDMELRFSKQFPCQQNSRREPGSADKDRCGHGCGEQHLLTSSLRVNDVASGQRRPKSSGNGAGKPDRSKPAGIERGRQAACARDASLEDLDDEREGAGRTSQPSDRMSSADTIKRSQDIRDSNSSSGGATGSRSSAAFRGKTRKEREAISIPMVTRTVEGDETSEMAVLSVQLEGSSDVSSLWRRIPGVQQERSASPPRSARDKQSEADGRNGAQPYQDGVRSSLLGPADCW